MEAPNLKQTGVLGLFLNPIELPPRPYLEEVLTEQSLNDDPKGLVGLYRRALRVVPEKLSVLLGLTHKVHDKSSSLQQQHLHR